METGSVKAHVNPDMEVGGKAFVVVAMTTALTQDLFKVLPKDYYDPGQMKVCAEKNL